MFKFLEQYVWNNASYEWKSCPLYPKFTLRPLKAFFFSYILPQIFCMSSSAQGFSFSLSHNSLPQGKRRKFRHNFSSSLPLFFLTKSSLKCSQTDDCVVLMRRSTERMNIFYVIKNAFYTFVFGKREIWWECENSMMSF